MRLLFGLERIPRGLAPDDPRLPGVELGPSPLRLNSERVPDAILAGAGEGHAARVAACLDWLQSQCGDYAAPQRRLIAEYFAFVANEIEHHRSDLAQALERYGGLYTVEDWTWSAPRPLPRAWIREDEAWMRRDIAFWDGRALKAIRTGDAFPASFGTFWRGETLPRSPFRRPALALPA